MPPLPSWFSVFYAVSFSSPYLQSEGFTSLSPKCILFIGLTWELITRGFNYWVLSSVRGQMRIWPSPFPKSSRRIISLSSGVICTHLSWRSQGRSSPIVSCEWLQTVLVEVVSGPAFVGMGKGQISHLQRGSALWCTNCVSFSFQLAQKLARVNWCSRN